MQTTGRGNRILELALDVGLHTFQLSPATPYHSPNAPENSQIRPVVHLKMDTDAIHRRLLKVLVVRDIT